ncbi:MAG: flagellar FlbD family protein [Bacillota bacterium]
MIKVTRLNKEEYVINCDLVEFIEATPDTVITLTTGKKVVVLETIDDVISKIIQYKQMIFSKSTVSDISSRNEV